MSFFNSIKNKLHIGQQDTESSDMSLRPSGHWTLNDLGDSEDTLLPEMRNRIRFRNQHRDSDEFKLYIYRPTTAEDSLEIVEMMKEEFTIIINLEGIDFKTTQRIYDFVSGACYTMGGNFQRLSDQVFLAARPEAEVSGDVMENIIKYA